MTNARKAVIFGLSSLAEVADYYLTDDSYYEVVGFTASDDRISTSTFRNRRVVPFGNIEKEFPSNEVDLFIAVGYTGLNSFREQIFYQAKEKGYRLLSYVSSRASVWPELAVGENVFIFEENTIQPFVEIGHNNILWSGNHVGHHTRIGANNFISSHVVISGHCMIGDNSFFGVNCTIADSLTIGNRNLIGPGALIQKSTGDDEAYFAPRTEKHRAKSSRFM